MRLALVCANCEHGAFHKTPDNQWVCSTCGVDLAVKLVGVE